MAGARTAALATDSAAAPRCHLLAAPACAGLLLPGLFAARECSHHAAPCSTHQVITHLYYTAEKPGLRLWFANCFKMGLIASLLADAAKLGS